jgi:hypothetical protein
MRLGRADIDAALFHFLAILDEAGGKRPSLAQDGVERGAEFAGQMDHDQDGSRLIGGQFAGQEAQRLTTPAKVPMAKMSRAKLFSYGRHRPSSVNGRLTEVVPVG